MFAKWVLYVSRSLSVLKNPTRRPLISTGGNGRTMLSPMTFFLYKAPHILPGAHVPLSGLFGNLMLFVIGSKDPSLKTGYSIQMSEELLLETSFLPIAG